MNHDRVLIEAIIHANLEINVRSLNTQRRIYCVGHCTNWYLNKHSQQTQKHQIFYHQQWSEWCYHSHSHG